MRLAFNILLAFLVLSTSAQDKLLTINDAIRGYHLYPRGLSQLQWLPKTNNFSQVITDDGGNRVLSIQEVEETHNGLVHTVSLDDINSSLGTEAQLKSLPYADWINATEFQFHNQGAMHAYDYKSKKIRKLYECERGVDHAPSHDGYMQIVEDGIKGKIKGKDFIATNSNEGIVIGQTVHRSEFGITNGLFWSPSGKTLAYYEMDESMVTEYPLYALNDTPATANMIRYPTAGGVSHHVQVKIFHSELEKTITIKTGEPKEQFLTNVSITPDDKHVLIAIVNRAQNHMWLNMYSTETGEFEKTLFEETNERYVEPEHPAQFLKSNPEQFVWWSERDGYNHLYLYDLSGKMIKQLTKGKWIVTSFHGFSTDGSKLFITSTEESPLERHLYCIDVKSGKSKKLTKDAGYHSIRPNSDMTYFIDQFSSEDVATKVQIITEDGALFENLHETPDPLKGYKLGEMELGKLKGDGGHDLYYRVFKPVDFDKNKKYPVVVYLYNGPHLQLVTNRWMGGANLWYQYMAQNGYVVFSIDGRGSANRGFEFESAVHRHMAEYEMDDQLTGVNWLKKQSWVDADRIGIHGWSYGGYMTTSLMSRRPGVFKVGVAGGPVIDWSLYEVMYTERYMDTPQENPEGYANSDLKNHVENLEGKLLMIHGGQDNVVLWQHSLQYLETAIKKGVQLDYFVYPHHPHNVGGKDRVHLYEKVSNYFFDNL